MPTLLTAMCLFACLHGTVALIVGCGCIAIDPAMGGAVRAKAASLGLVGMVAFVAFASAFARAMLP